MSLAALDYQPLDELALQELLGDIYSHSNLDLRGRNSITAMAAQLSCYADGILYALQDDELLHLVLRVGEMVVLLPCSSEFLAEEIHPHTPPILNNDTVATYARFVLQCLVGALPMGELVESLDSIPLIEQAPVSQWQALAVLLTPLEAEANNQGWAIRAHMLEGTCLWRGHWQLSRAGAMQFINRELVMDGLYVPVGL